MIKDWRLLKMICDEDGEEEIDTRDFTEKELLEYIGPDSEIRAEFTAFQRFRDEETLMENVGNYSDEQLRKLVMLFSSFSLNRKALIVGLEALNRFPNNPELLTLSLRAARHVDRGGVGQHLLVKLIYDVPRERLGFDGYQEALRFLLPTAEQDRELCKELLKDYSAKLKEDGHTDFSDEIAYWLLKSEFELTLGQYGNANKALDIAFEKLPSDWKACGEEVSSEKLRDMVDHCSQLGRDYAKEFELVKRAWSLRRNVALHSSGEV